MKLKSPKKYMKIICWLLTVMMVSGLFGFSAPHAYANETDLSPLEEYEEILSAFGERYHFSDYMSDHAHAERPALAEDIVINAADYSIIEGMDARHETDFEGEPGVSVYTEEQGLIQWEVNMPQAGLYNISVRYYTVAGRNADIQRAIFINGEQPFFEASPIEFRRTWVNQLDYIQQDSLGNDMRPTQVEQPIWSESLIRDAMGTYNEPFSFYLEQGLNTISFVSLREPMLIRALRIHQAAEVLPYAEVSARQADLPRPSLRQVGGVIRIEGQDAVRKSSPMLAPGADTGGPGVMPYDARYIRINHIGGGSWSDPGAWIEWEAEVAEAGLYSIALNVRQNYQRGANSYRRITVNGEVPFSEVEAYAFDFRTGWRVETLGGDEPYLFYLNEGTNIIRMETVLGDYAPHLREVQEIIFNLNTLYRQIVMITGITPDVFREYQINRRLPHLKESLIYERDRLDRIYADLTSMAAGRGQRDAIINSMSQLLTMLSDDIEQIPRRVKDFRTNIGSLGTWMMMVRDQPIAVDSIHILPHDAPTPTNGRSWLRQIWHEIMTLFYSFIIDYNTIGTAIEGENARNIEVWIGTGRDQANVIKAMIDESFTRETGIGVSLMLVDVNTLLPATVARQGPDITLSVWNTLPMDYGLRGAVADISQMPGFDEVAQRFHPSAMTPYEFEGRVFALPETMSFPMLFYRKDILHEIGLDIPETWDDVHGAIAHLSRFHMMFGLPVITPGPPIIDHTSDMYNIFLFQNGGALYNEDATRSALDSEIALNAFRDFTRFYTDYNIDKEYNFVNRFRNGEIPLAIADYTNYNALQVFAPELRGLWGFCPVPGTVREDGTISRAVPTGGNAVIMMENANDKDAAWEFMMWWTSAETQTQFGRRMEALMGSAARHPTANMEAFARMAWPVADYQNLNAQMQEAVGLRQIPGAYFTPRQVRNAFYTVVELEEIGPREALTDYVRFINDEIRAKRREFGMD